MTSDRKIKANRKNARASTGPKTVQGHPRTARNARRHGLSLPICTDPALSEEVEKLAREIARPDANVKKWKSLRAKLPGLTPTPKPKNSPAGSPKHRSIFAACVTRAINCSPMR
jgi:hypothetical protein